MANPITPALTETLEQLVWWMRTQVLPLWWQAGFDSATGFCFERLSTSGEAEFTTPYPVVTQAHQIYVRARAEQLGWIRGGMIPIGDMWGFVSRRATLPNRSDGYVHTLDESLNPADPCHRLADHADFIAASVASYSAYGNGADLRRAINIVDWLDLRLLDSRGGWSESSCAQPGRSSDAHLRLLLAFLYLFETTQKSRWLDYCKSLVALCEQRFVHSGVVVERFTGNWQPSGDWSPQQQFGWVVALRQCERHGLAVNLDLALLYRRASSQASVVAGQVSPGLYPERVRAGRGEGDSACAALAAQVCAGMAQLQAGFAEAEADVCAAVHTLFERFVVPGAIAVLGMPRSANFVAALGQHGYPTLAYADAQSLRALFDACIIASKWLRQR